MSLISFIWKFIRLQPYRFFFIFLLSLTWSVDSTLWPYLLRLIIDTMTAHEMERGAVFGALGGLFAATFALWIGVPYRHYFLKRFFDPLLV